MKDFQFTYWKDSPKGEGLVTLEKTCTYEQLRQAIKDHLNSILYTDDFGDQYTLYDLLDYLHTSVLYDQADTNIPIFRWVYCWPTEGANEGHYFHVECTTPEGDTHPLLLAKTCSGDSEFALLVNMEINRFILNQRI